MPIDSWRPTSPRVAIAAFVAIVCCMRSSPLPADDREATSSLVATHYFYWYRWPDQHFNQPGAPGHEGHYHHLPNPESVSYLSEAWHESQLRAMRSAGIDIALPVYWGAPGAYERESIRFSRDGLAPMVAAATKLGDDGVKLGLFYDTSTLLNDVRGARPRGGRADLTSDEGRELFTRTITDFFAEIPPALWARVDGRALVVLYGSAFAARWDRGLGAATRAAFSERFPGESVFFVSDVSWGDVGQDRTTAWGAALGGPKLFPGIAQIGPGYDDSPVPGRRTPKRERENGDFYRHSWRAALAHRPSLVLIETWNEMHEGTEICETIETERLYLDITREWTRKLKSGDEPGPAIALRWPRARNRPDRTWGEDAEGRSDVLADYASESPHRGLRERAWEDGPIERRDGAVRSPASAAEKTRYLYFQVSDHFAFELPDDPGGDFVLEVRTIEPASIDVEYDSHDRAATLEGAYTRAPRGDASSSAASRTHRFLLNGAFFANRQNGGSDLRLLLRSSAVDVTFARIHAANPADALEPIRISPDGARFIRSRTGDVFRPWGVNYDHDGANRLIEDYWIEEWSTLVEDFHEIAALGANVVRVHLQVARFLDAPNEPNEASLRQFAKLVALAEETRLYLDITGLGCYDEQPGWYAKLDERARWDAQVVFWKAVAKVCAKSPAIFCYDLMNEPILPGAGKPETDWLAGEFAGKHFVQRITLDLRDRTREQVAKQWVDELVQAIREHDEDGPITVGVIPWSMVWPNAKPIFYSETVGEKLDFVSAHFYPESGKVDAALKALAAYDVGKPLVIEETFPLRCSRDELQDFLERSREHAEGAISFYWGTTIAEYAAKPSPTIGDAITREWLERFREMAPGMKAR